MHRGWDQARSRLSKKSPRRPSFCNILDNRTCPHFGAGIIRVKTVKIQTETGSNSESARWQTTSKVSGTAAMSMARLWRDQGKRDEARDLLAPVYGWFTEGFDTLDLKEAKALLEELAA